MAERTHPAPGDLVRIRDDRWRVVRCVPSPEGAATLEVTRLGTLHPGLRATFLLPFEPCERLPHDTRPRAVSLRRWRRVACRVLAGATPAWTSIRAAARARLDLIPFQLEPALALTRGRACRFLIADAVGLGKTVQAGLMIAETLERLPGSRALVVAPAGLRDQWLAELNERFGLSPKILDADRVSRAAADLPEGANPWTIDPLVITSIDFVKRADVIRSLETLLWDIVVFDEAHALAGRSDRAKAANAIAARARAVVLLTATPHSGDDDAFQRLCGIGELQDRSPLVVFRRSRETLGAGRTRRTRVLRIRLAPDEHAMHLALSRYARLAGEQGNLPGGLLAISVLQRRAASSAASLASSLERRIAILMNTRDRPAEVPQLPLPFDDHPDDDAPPEEELSAPALSSLDEELDQLTNLLSLARQAANAESKIRAVVRLLRRIKEPAIVFTQYRDTLSTLAQQLPDHVSLHGGLSARERRETTRRFTHAGTSLLLATDAASEGLNLHYRCRIVVNLEMPWTALRLEQRVGRVDRLGQQRDVHALHLIARDTGEEALAALVTARSSLADAVADQNDPGIQRDALSECHRIRATRQLHDGAASHDESRPVMATRRGTSRRLAWTYRVSFGEDDGFTWESLIPLDICATAMPRKEAAGLLRILPRLPAVADRVADASLAEALRFRTDTASVVERLAHRERAILFRLQAHRARLSRALLQPGLFDRRVERVSSAQHRLLEDAERQCAVRLDLLERLRTARNGAAVPVFGIAYRG